jgi:hypothetical protein
MSIKHDTAPLSPETFRAVREREACDAMDRALDRRDRMVATVEARGIAVDACGVVAESIVRASERAAMGTGEGLRTGAACAVSRELEARGVATRYALDARQTGAIPSARMRVRGRAPTATPAQGAPTPAADTVLARAEQAARVACSDLRGLIPAFHRASGPGRKALLSRVNLILRDYAEDPRVLAVARDAGWRV